MISAQSPKGVNVVVLGMATMGCLLSAADMDRLANRGYRNNVSRIGRLCLAAGVTRRPWLGT
jgi:hypothetical protein